MHEARLTRHFSPTRRPASDRPERILSAILWLALPCLLLWLSA